MEKYTNPGGNSGNFQTNQHFEEVKYRRRRNRAVCIGEVENESSKLQDIELNDVDEETIQKYLET